MLGWSSDNISGIVVTVNTSGLLLFPYSWANLSGKWHIVWSYPLVVFLSLHFYQSGSVHLFCFVFTHFFSLIFPWAVSRSFLVCLSFIYLSICSSGRPFFYRAQEEEIDQDQLVFATFLSVRMCVCVCVCSALLQHLPLKWEFICAGQQKLLRPSHCFDNFNVMDPQLHTCL